MVKSSDVSVIIPSYNAQKTILQCLRALEQQTVQPLEIIVVDSSQDQTPEIVRQNFPNVILRHLSAQTFPGPARNMGARKANGTILAFIDADCIPDPDWIKRIIDRYSEGHQVVGGSVGVGDPNNPYAWAGHLMEFREVLPIGSAHTVEHVPSCNISYQKDIFNDSGGFPEAYYPQEDFLLDYLLTLQGIKILFDPEIRIRHFCRDNLRGYISHQHRIGRVTRCALSKLSLPGSSFARTPFLAWLVSPLLGIVKFINTTAAFVFHYPRVALRHPEIVPLLVVGIVWWARGFAAGALGGLSGIRGWEDPNEPIFSRIHLSSTSTPKTKGE
jgi:glycosyltransferase involved in cell wall biosynthesis